MFASTAEALDYIKTHLPHPTYRAVDLDRIDNNGHYAPGNLRLTTRSRNLRNTRNTTKVLWRGQWVPVVDWAENPYSVTAAGRYARQGLTGEEIQQRAEQSVREKRKGWQKMQDRLRSTTS